MKIQDADRLFTKEGFWRLVFPQMIVLDLFFAGILTLVLGGPSGVKGVMAGIITLLALWGAHAISYDRARKKHEALKAEYGDKYIQLIERNEVRLSPTLILMTSAPASATQLLTKQP
jgi:hypothetical protein